MKDASLKTTKALPNGAASTTADPIDTQKTTAQGSQPGELSFNLQAPLLTAALLASGVTMTYDILHADSAAAIASTPTVLIDDAITQTGASPGAGAAAAEYAFRLPPAAKRFVSVRATNAGAGNASTASMVLEADVK